MTYNHAFTLAFEIPGSTDPEGNDITPQQYREALLKRMNDLDKNNEWEEAIGAPYDTFEESA